MMFGAFLSAWKIVATAMHNKNMERLNNPTPEVLASLKFRTHRAAKIAAWALSRWGSYRIEVALKEMDRNA